MAKARRNHTTPRTSSATAAAIEPAAGTPPIRVTSPDSRARKSADPIFAVLAQVNGRRRKIFEICDALNEDKATDKELDHAIDSFEQAAGHMSMTQPTTVAGASAMLKHVTQELFESGEQSWHKTAFSTVTAALAKIARQAQRAAA
jgi:uncharacterized protein Yka (UPF0111/DUF47 family)